MLIFSRSLMVLLMTTLVIVSAGIAGCTSQAPSAQASHGTISTLEPAEMALQASDVPADFTLVEQGERNATDMNDWALAHGWKKGYYTVYRINNKTSPNPGAVLEQYISIYPEGNISLVVPDTAEKLSNITIGYPNVTVEKLSAPALGDAQCSFMLSDATDNTVLYDISFSKKDVYMEFQTNGTAADYEMLRNLAGTAALKIR
jgi:hypothetical protein